MSFSQRLNIKQSTSLKQTLSTYMLRNLNLLELSNTDLNQFLKDKSLENPFLQVEENDFIGIDTEMQDLSWIPNQKESLFDFLKNQILINYRKTFLRDLIFWWLDHIDDNGFVTHTVEEAAEITQVDPVQLLDALVLFQQLDPAGVGARDMRESFMLQTERRNDAPDIAYLVLEECFDELINNKWSFIANRYDVKIQKIQEIFDFIQTLNIRPTFEFQRNSNPFIKPELKVTTEEGKVILMETAYSTPLISFDEDYARSIEKQDQETKKYIKEKNEEFQSLYQALEQRKETIFRVGSYIIQKQATYLLNESKALSPLRLYDIAKELKIHESTVSRAINEVYIETDSGIKELNEFLSHSIGEKYREVSSDLIEQSIKIHINNEDKKKPLSDQKIADLFLSEDIEISRRTVAKYRKNLNIPSSSKRKRFD